MPAGYRGSRDDLIADTRVQRPGQNLVQQRAGIRLLEALNHQLRQSGHVVRRLPRREDQSDRFRLQATGGEPESLRGRAIQPLLVIHQADQRPLRRHLGQQAQRGQSDQEPVGCRAGTDAERRPQGITLRNWQLIDVIQHRRAHLLQSGERQLHLRLDTCRAGHPAARRRVGDVVQQRRLAHPRLAAQHQRPALTDADSADQVIEHPALAASARQPFRAPSDRGTCRHQATLHICPVVVGPGDGGCGPGQNMVMSM